jgi:hypothetical protein
MVSVFWPSSLGFLSFWLFWFMVLLLSDDAAPIGGTSDLLPVDKTNSKGSTDEGLSEGKTQMGARRGTGSEAG